MLKLEELKDAFLFSDVFLFSDAAPNAKWAVGRSSLSFETDLHRAEKPFRAELKTAIRALCSGRSVSLSAEVRYFVAVRAQVVWWFLRHFEIVDSRREVSQTILPFPEGLASSEIIAWFLFDWFNANGGEIAAMLMLQEMHMNRETNS